MKLDEALNKIADVEVREFLTKIINDQNTYVTKLEAQLKGMSNQEPTDGLNDYTRKFIVDSMREKVIAAAEKQILAKIPAEIYNAVKPEYIKFLNERMDEAHMTVEFAVDAFSLTLGRYQTAGNSLVTPGKANPQGTPVPQQTNPAPAQQPVIPNAQQILNMQPPVMTNRDPSVTSGMVLPETKPIQNTRDAMQRFKNRMKANGGSKFQ